MLKNLKLTSKFTILTLSILFLISVIFYGSSEFVFSRLANEEFNDDLQELYANFINDNLSEIQVLSISSNALDSDQEAKQLLIKQDREGLYKRLLPVFNNNKEQFSVDLLEYYLPDGTNLLRMQAKEAFGDKGAHAEFFKKILETKKEASGLEFEFNNIALRVIRPYYFENKLIGYIEVGENISHLIDEMKKRVDNDFSVFVDKESLTAKDIQNIKNSTNFNSNLETPKHLELISSGNNKLMKICFDDSVSETVKIKQYYLVRELQDSGKTYICSVHNITGLDGKHIAVLVSLSDITSFINIININRLIIVGTLIISALFFLFVVNYFIRRIILNPLEDLNETSKEIAQGNLDKGIEIRSSDEIGQLASSFDNMTEKLKQSYENLESKIQNRTADLAKKTTEVEKKNEESEQREQAILNIMDDLDLEKRDLERINAKDEAFLKSIGEGLIVVDKEGRVVLASKKALELIGYTVDSLLGKIWTQDVPIVEDESGKRIPYEKTPVYGALHNKGTVTTRFWYKIDGKKFPVLVTAAPVVIEGENQGAVVVFRDITKEEEVDRAKSEFISLASHQLRTPLSAIKWFVELLEDTKNLTQEQTDFIGDISKSTQRMIDLVNALLNVSRIESGRIEISPQLTDLSAIVKDVLLGLEKDIESKKLQVSVDADSISEINVNQKMIRMVYENLLSNAVKYTPDNGKISVSLKKQGQEIISEITDNGIGIPETDHARVFDRFYRGVNASKLVSEGTGLGLYLAKIIVNSSGGKIGYKSVEGSGSTFWFSVPVSGMLPKKGEVSLS